MFPQQYATPSVVRPHVWYEPALRPAKRSPPVTATGAVRAEAARQP